MKQFKELLFASMQIDHFTALYEIKGALTPLLDLQVFCHLVVNMCV